MAEQKEPSREEVVKAREEYILRYGGGKRGKGDPTPLQKHLGNEFDEMYANYKPRKWRLTDAAKKDKTKIPMNLLKVDDAAIEAKVNNRLAPDLCTIPTCVEIVD